MSRLSQKDTEIKHLMDEFNENYNGWYTDQNGTVTRANYFHFYALKDFLKLFCKNDCDCLADTYFQCLGALSKTKGQIKEGHVLIVNNCTKTNLYGIYNKNFDFLGGTIADCVDYYTKVSFKDCLVVQRFLKQVKTIK